MDLSRAKTVLILTFLCLNIVLLYQIWADEAGDSPVLFGGEEKASQLEAALQQANLFLNITLPRGGMRVAHLEVTPWQPDPAEVIHIFWNALAEGEDTAARQQHILPGDGPMILSGVFAGLPPGQLRTAAQAFVEQIPFLNDFVYDYIISGDNVTALYYRQEFAGFPLYAGYLQFRHEGAGTKDSRVDVYIYRLSPLGFAEQEREVIPPATALWRFLETYTGENGQAAAIVEFSLGYYSEEYAAQLWEIAPVWRIRLDNGEVYYINAFTGYREG
jgi:hypothetical protein